jgi:hypothetical protein
MLGHCYSCTARMNNGGTGCDALGSTQFLIGEHSSVTHHKGATAVALTLAAVFLACTVYARRWGGRAPIGHTLPDTKLGVEVDPLSIPPLHNTVRSHLTWWVIGALVAVLVIYKCATNEVTVNTKCACGAERHALEVAVVREAGSWSVSPARNNLLKRHACYPQYHQ